MSAIFSLLLLELSSLENSYKVNWWVLVISRVVTGTIQANEIKWFIYTYLIKYQYELDKRINDAIDISCY